MFPAILTVVALLVATIVYYVIDLMKKRQALDGLPQPPMKSKLMGHLDLVQELMVVFPENVHSHVWPDYIRVKYNLPEVFYFDMRPFGPLWLYVADPELSSRYLTVTQSLPKSHLETDFINHLLGNNNIVSLEGQKWKLLRSMFNPGFSATNIMNMADFIVDASLAFCQVMREKAETGELFQLEEYATRLTIDVIGRVSLDMDIQAQKRIHPIVKYFRERLLLMPPATAVFPWQSVDLTRPFRLWWNGRHLNNAISKELDAIIVRRGQAFLDEQKGLAKSFKTKSIIDLALATWEKEILSVDGASSDSKAPKRITEPSQLPRQLRQDLIDQIKTFFFAGHDTTSSTIAWCHYLLHRFPQAHAKVQAELDSIFPPGTDAAQTIRQDPHIINKLEYTTATIKETLRLFPPASTLRQINRKYAIPQNETFIIDPKTGQNFPMEGAHMWPAAHLIHRNKRFFPQPTHFVPERFIPSQTPFPECELFTPAGKDAWRPFEKGPRNCIGQELAMTEAKIIMALTAREFDFTLEYPGEEPDLQYPIPDSAAAESSENTEYGKGIRDGTVKALRVEGHRLWPTLIGSAKPNGGCPVRVKVRPGY